MLSLRKRENSTSLVKLSFLLIGSIVGCQAQHGPPTPQPSPAQPLASHQARSSAPEPTASAPTAIVETLPLVDPEPSATNYLVWGPPWPAAADGGTTSTWLAAESAGLRVVGQTPGALVAAGPDVWQWTTKDWHLTTVCDEQSQGTFAEESIFVSALVRRLGSSESVDVIKGGAEPLQCSSITDSHAYLLGSAGPYLFVDSSFHEYGGGAHGITISSFVLFDLAARSAWYGWDKEIAVAETALKPIKESLGERAGPRAPRGGSPYVNLRPSTVRPAYAPDGNLSLAVQFEVADTNVPELSWSMSRGSVLGADAALAPIPERLMPYATAPPAVTRFIRDSKIVVGGWSSLPAGMPMPREARALFAERR